jgi:hypothetical protein
VNYIKGGQVGLIAQPSTLTYDVLVQFDNPQDTYDLQKDEVITITFIMKRAGGCFLPYSGEHGVISKRK